MSCGALVCALTGNLLERSLNHGPLIREWFYSAFMSMGPYQGTIGSTLERKGFIHLFLFWLSMAQTGDCWRSDEQDKGRYMAGSSLSCPDPLGGSPKIEPPILDPNTPMV